MWNRPARSSSDACASQSKTSDQPPASSSAENKGSGEASAQDMSAQQECQSSGPNHSSSDRRERERPDTTAKPEGRSLKTAGTSSSDQRSTPGHGTHAEDSQGFDTMLWRAARRVAQTREEATEQALIMHNRTPAWKLPDCKRH